MIQGSARRTLFASTAAICAAAAQPAWAQVRAFDVPAQSVRSAVTVLGKQGDVQIIAARRITQGKRANAVRGTMTVPDALTRMFQGTGLVARQTGSQTYIVVSEQTSSLSSAPVSAALPAVAAAVVAAQDSQTAAAASAEDGETAETVVVTASRVRRTGFIAPTPTTVVGASELRQGGRTDLGAALADVPQFRATNNPTQTRNNIGAAGTYTADLRGLDPVRTLVLVDGRRPVNTTTDSFNLGVIPFSLIDRVEVVTGGASAAWGSGAVAGVVNVILRDNLTGFRGSLQYGISSRGDGAERHATLAYGSPFAGGRGHLVAGFNYVDNDGIVPFTARPWAGKWALLANPQFTATNGQPQFLVRSNVNQADTARGGLILSGPFAGQSFGRDGVLRPFDTGTLRSGQFVVGGGGNSNDEFSALSIPYKRTSGYGIVTYDLTDTLQLRGDLLYTQTRSVADFFPVNDTNLTISVNNAFLPAAVRNSLVAAGQTSFRMGRVNDDIGVLRNDLDARSLQGTLSIKGDLGRGWSWDAYYTYGRTKTSIAFINQRISSLFAESVDSVISPTTGQPICRSALTVPTTACVPINLFGYGAPSPAAIAYFTGTSRNEPFVSLRVAAASLRGEPFSTWAGPVSVALGGEWRREVTSNKVDDLSLQRRFTTINFGLLAGTVSVREGFVETVVPLVKDVPLIKSFEVNAAARLSDYNTSGSILSWKVGASHQVFDDLRIRGTRSRDIRAPNVPELFSVASFQLGNILDPVTKTTLQVLQPAGGNANLEPEIAKTTTVGAIYSPGWIKGLDLSVDYYDIKISGAIATLSGQQIVDQCFAGRTELCGLITRDAAGRLSEIRRFFINLSEFETGGVDFELAYTSPTLSRSFPGKLRLRLLANYVDRLISDDGITRLNTVNQLGTGIVGVPRWRGTGSISYATDQVTIDLRARYIGAGDRDRTRFIDDNRIGSETYVDLGLQFSLDAARPERIVLYGNVRNLFDNDPPRLPNTSHYDLVGRYLTAGVRMAF